MMLASLRNYFCIIKGALDMAPRSTYELKRVAPGLSVVYVCGAESRQGLSVLSDAMW